MRTIVICGAIVAVATAGAFVADHLGPDATAIWQTAVWLTACTAILICHHRLSGREPE